MGLRHRKADPDERCIVIGCAVQPRGHKSPYCEKHYYRLYKSGKPTAHPGRPVPEPDGARKPPKERYINHGYVRLYRPGHHLADKKGYVYEHRLVLFDTLHRTASDIRCHWCKKDLTATDVVPDHLDDDTLNNAPENIVPSCSVCNLRRGKSKAISIKAQRHAERKKAGYRPPRRNIPIAVKRAVAQRQGGICLCGCKTPIWTKQKCNVQWDHDPALRLRDVNRRKSDYIPAQHDPDYIVGRCGASHAAKTHGRGATTAGTDAGKIKKERKREKLHRAPNKPKRGWLSRPLGKRPPGAGNGFPPKGSTPMRRK
jgi:hypothetical protein